MSAVVIICVLCLPMFRLGVVYTADFMPRLTQIFKFGTSATLNDFLVYTQSKSNVIEEKECFFSG